MEAQLKPHFAIASHKRIDSLIKLIENNAKIGDASFYILAEDYSNEDYGKLRNKATELKEKHNAAFHIKEAKGPLGVGDARIESYKLAIEEIEKTDYDGEQYIFINDDDILHSAKTIELMLKLKNIHKDRPAISIDMYGTLPDNTLYLESKKMFCFSLYNYSVIRDCEEHLTRGLWYCEDNELAHLATRYAGKMPLVFNKSLFDKFDSKLHFSKSTISDRHRKFKEAYEKLNDRYCERVEDMNIVFYEHASPSWGFEQMLIGKGVRQARDIGNRKSRASAFYKKESKKQKRNESKR